MRFLNGHFKYYILGLFFMCHFLPLCTRFGFWVGKFFFYQSVKNWRAISFKKFRETSVPSLWSECLHMTLALRQRGRSFISPWRLSTDQSYIPQGSTLAPIETLPTEAGNLWDATCSSRTGENSTGHFVQSAFLSPSERWLLATVRNQEDRTAQEVVWSQIVWTKLTLWAAERRQENWTVMESRKVI